MVDFAPPALLFAELNAWPWRDRVQVQRVNWCSDNLEQQFDMIIGSDILYDRSDLPHLDRFIRAHRAPPAAVFLGEPNRTMATEFITWFEAHAWNIEQHRVFNSQTTRPVRVLEMSPV